MVALRNFNFFLRHIFCCHCTSVIGLPFRQTAAAAAATRVMKLVIERYNDLAGTSSTLWGTAHGPSAVAHVFYVVVLHCWIVMFLNKLLLEVVKKFSRTLCKQDIISTGYLTLQVIAVGIHIKCVAVLYMYGFSKWTWTQKRQLEWTEHMK